MTDKKKQPKSNIICDAKNCVYNSEKARRCTANEIRVGTEHASNSAETICATFVCGSEEM